MDIIYIYISTHTYIFIHTSAHALPINPSCAFDHRRVRCVDHRREGANVIPGRSVCLSSISGSGYYIGYTLW
jgi:hypothetical protein